VDEKQFKQKLILLSGGHTEVILYFGSSPGFRKVYVRQGHEEEVFAVEFDTSTMAVKTEDWIDKEILILKEDDVEPADEGN